MQAFLRAIGAVAVVYAWGATTTLHAQAQSPVPPRPSLQGEWNFNDAASTKAPDSLAGNGQPRTGGGLGRGGGRRGGRGGFGGGTGGAGGTGAAGGAGASANSAGAARLRDALRDLTTPPQRLTIVGADQTIIITTEQGKTTRLAPTDKKIKDENTGIERKTKWDGANLSTEVSGLPGTVVQTLSVDADQHQLHVVTTLPNRQDSKNPIVLDRVYDRAAQ